MITLKQVPDNASGRLNTARVYTLLSKRKNSAFFHVDEPARHIKLYIPDMMLVSANPSNKRLTEVILRNGEKHFLINCALHTLLGLSTRLVQVNKDQLLSVDAINEIRHDLITLKNMPGNKPAYVTLNRDYRNSLKEKLSYR